MEGGGRTIAGLILPTKHDLRAVEDWNDSPYYETGVMGATSGATPALTVSAALFREYWRAAHSSYIDAPGALYTFLLMMGDRWDQDGTYLDEDFDNITGAGRLRLRMFDLAGLDDPNGWSAGSECISHNEVYTDIELNDGNALSADVDYIKAVIWWYDHDHDDGCAGTNPVCNDNIHLRLQNNTGGVWQTVSDGLTLDNRQRVYDGNPGASVYRLRINGYDVTSDGEGCGLLGVHVRGE